MVSCEQEMPPRFTLSVGVSDVPSYECPRWCEGSTGQFSCREKLDIDVWMFNQFIPTCFWPPSPPCLLLFSSFPFSEGIWPFKQSVTWNVS